MWPTRKTKRQLHEVIFKLFDKYGPENVTLKQARDAARKINLATAIDKDRLCGYRGAYAARGKHKKRKRHR